MHLRIAVLSLFVLAALGLPLATAQAAKKSPIPSKKEQDEKGVLIYELFKQDFDAADRVELKRRSAENARLARILLEEARSTNDDPAGRYKLLDVALFRALLAEEPKTALEAIDEMDQHFVLPPHGTLDKKIEALQGASKVPASRQTLQFIINYAEYLISVAKEEDDYASAMKLLDAAENAARGLRDVPQFSRIRQERERIQEQEKKFTRWKPYADTLGKSPQDAEANLAMGVYQALLKGNWDKGLPLLARSSDPRLKKVAQLDLADPRPTGNQISMAQMWFDLAQKNPVPKLIEDKEFDDSGKIEILLRSYHWYQDALGFQSGKERDKTEQILQKITAMLPPEYAVGELTREFWRWSDPQAPMPIYCAAFSPDSKKVISSGADGVLRLFEVHTGKQLRQFDGLSGRIWTVCFSADSHHVITGGYDGSIRLWNVGTGREVRRFTGHTDYVRSVVESRDGKLILSCGDDATIRLWNLGPGKEITTFPKQDHFVWSVALSRDASQALSAGLDRTVRLWDVQAGKQLKEMRGHKDTVLSVVFTPNNRAALSGSTDKNLILWDLATDKYVVFPQMHAGYVHSVAVSPDGRRALSGSQDRTVRLWDLHSHKELRVLYGHTDRVWHVAFSPDGRLGLSCGEDGTLRIWSGSKYR